MSNKNVDYYSVGILLAILIVIPLYVFVLAPVSLWMIFNPLGITVAYMGRVSIGVGLLILKFSIGSRSE